MGGGGANLLNSPEIGENSDFEGVEDPKRDSGNTTWTEPTFKTYDDYFTDLNITAETITEQDLTGKGSASDPYIVHSTRGFLWLTNYSLSGINLNLKNLELACDIILNDEKFDENGTPSGGDGVIYSWSQLESGTRMNIEGNNHIVKGMYFNNSSSSEIALFSGVKVNKIQNMKVEEFYLKAKERVSSFSTHVLGRIEHCISKGFIYAEKECAGISLFANEIEKCDSFTYIKGAAECGGIIHSVSDNAIISECNNFGTISGKNYLGGIVGYYWGQVINLLGNCSNYGDIISTGDYVGGIMSAVMGGRVNIYNSVNYGKIIGNVSVGGLVGYAAGVLNVDQFVNYAFISGEKASSGGFIGQIYKSSDSRIGKVSLMNSETIVDLCRSKVQGFVGQVRSVEDVVLKISNSKVKIVGSNFQKDCGLLWQLVGPVHCELKNITINVDNDGSPQNFFLINSCSSTNLFIQNIMINTTFKNTANTLVNKCSADLKIENCISCSKLGEGVFFGNDFSGFYVDFKTGEIGLKSRRGKGFYQGKVTEELLITRGFSKKS